MLVLGTGAEGCDAESAEPETELAIRADEKGYSPPHQMGLRECRDLAPS